MNSDHPVVDVSHWQGNIDFEAMKRDGVVGVIHKATESTGNVDDTYDTHKAQAEAAGLLWGAYHFLRPGNMQAQAEHFVRNAGTIDLYAADHEDTGVSLADLKAFLREVERLTDTKAIIYSGHVIKEQLSGYDAELAQHRLWLAHYTSGTPSWPQATWPTWWLWQYTDQGRVDGVDGNCDCNRYHGSEDDLFNEWTGEDAPAPGPTPTPEAEVTITITVEAKGAKINVVTK